MRNHDTVRVIATPSRDVIANFEVSRYDGHVLSLSSVDGSLVEWKDKAIAKDHGTVRGSAQFLDILAEFMSCHVVQGVRQ